MQKANLKPKQSEYSVDTELTKPQPLKNLARAAGAILDSVQHEHEAKVREREDKRRHDEFMRKAEESKIQEDLTRARAQEQQKALDTIANGLLAEVTRAQEEKRKAELRQLKQSEFDRYRGNVEQEFTALRSEGVDLVNQGKFALGVSKFSLAIGKIESLGEHWVVLQKDLGCPVRKFEYTEGLLAQVREQRKNAINSQAQTLISEAEVLSTKDFSLARQKLTEAKDLLAKISRYGDANMSRVAEMVTTQEQKVCWNQRKNEIVTKCNTLLRTADSASNLEDLVHELNVLRGILMTNAAFLDSKEKKLLSDLQNAISKYDQLLQEQRNREKRQAQRAKNIELQISAHNNINYTRQKLDVGDIPGALKTLSEAQELARGITDFSDIVDSSHTRAIDFDHSLQILQQERGAFVARSEQESRILATAIINAALSKFELDQKIVDLYTQHRHDLYDELVRSFQAHWHKFDRRPVAVEIQDEISQLIFARLKIIGWKKWILDWNKTVSVHEIGTCLDIIRLTLNAYTPAHKPPQVYVPIVAALPDHVMYLDNIPVADVAVDQYSENDEKAAKFPSAPSAATTGLFW